MLKSYWPLKPHNSPQRPWACRTWLGQRYRIHLLGSLALALRRRWMPRLPLLAMLMQMGAMESMLLAQRLRDPRL